MKYTVDENGCWIWPSLNSSGYGCLYVQRKPWGAHRWYYTQAKGAIPEGMTVDHLCFVPACVNPDHLRLLTPLENASNQRSKFKTHCVHGHEFTPENTVKWNGNRKCRICANAASNRAKARSAACHLCGAVMASGSLSRHRRRAHSALVPELQAVAS